MSLLSRLEHTVTVKRSTAGAGIVTSYQTVATGVKTLIQPLSPEANEDPSASFGTDFKAFFESDADIQEGDQLVDQDSNSYGVRGVRVRNYGPSELHHLEAQLGLDRSQL